MALKPMVGVGAVSYTHLPTSGTIEIAGTKVDGMKDKELAAFRNQKLGFVFQSFHLINSLSVLDNVELPLLYRKVSAKERRRLAEEVLKKVGLSHRKMCIRDSSLSAWI